MRHIFEYKDQKIRQTSEHRFWVKRFNDSIRGSVMFATLMGAENYIDTHSINH